VLYDLKLELWVFNLQSKVNHVKAIVHDGGQKCQHLCRA
jgi:hypothetical protein